MVSIRFSDLETRLDEMLSRAAGGETIEVTRDGAPVARIVPPNGHERSRIAGAAERLRSLRGSMRNTSIDEVCAMRHAGHDR